jgi:hypothetical protein
VRDPETRIVSEHFTSVGFSSFRMDIVLGIEIDFDSDPRFDLDDPKR